MLTLLSTNRSTIMTKLFSASLSLIAVIGASAAMTESAQAGAVRGGFNANTLAANDDGSAGPVSIGVGFNANFFGNTFNTLYVNNNGNVTLNSPLSTFTPFGIVNASTPIIAPFFADVDTRGNGSGLVTYGAGTIDGRQAFGVEWPGVGYYANQTNKLNTFELVLINRSDTGANNFDIEFNYDNIFWETGSTTQSGGTNGLGGNSARAGYSNGTGQSLQSFELSGSGVNGAFLNGGSNSLVANRLNSNIDGRYLFSVRNGAVVAPTTPTSPAIPTPALLPGLIGLGLGLLRRRKAEAADFLTEA
jgi:hypothetical protein